MPSSAAQNQPPSKRSDLPPDTERSALFSKVSPFKRKNFMNISNRTANDIFFPNQKTNHRHRSNRRPWSQDSSRAGSRRSAAMKQFSRSSIVPPTFLFSDRFGVLRDGFSFQ